MADLEKMSTAELRVELDRQLREQLVAAIEALPSVVTELIEDTARAVMRDFVGVRLSSMDRVEIDLYRHRDNPAIQAVHTSLAEHARSEFERIVGTTPVTLTKQQLAKARRGYQQELRDMLNDKLREKAIELAQAETDRLMGEIDDRGDGP